MVDSLHQGERRTPKKGCIDQIIAPVTCFFFFINFLFFIFGVAALGFGGVALFNEERLQVFAKMDETGALTDIKVAGFIKHFSIGLMAIGGLLLLVGFLGCFGVAVGVSCFIYMYCIIFAMMVIAQMVCFGIVYFFRDSVQMERFLEESVKTYEGKADVTTSNLENALILLMKYLKCCGVNGGEDFQASPWYFSDRRLSEETVPAICCRLKNAEKLIPVDTMCPKKPPGPNNPYTGDGCRKILLDYIFTRGIVATIVSTAIMLFQLLAICYAVVIERSFMDDDLAAKLNRV